MRCERRFSPDSTASFFMYRIFITSLLHILSLSCSLPFSSPWSSVVSVVDVSSLSCVDVVFFSFLCCRCFCCWWSCVFMSGCLSFRVGYFSQARSHVIVGLPDCRSGWFVSLRQTSTFAARRFLTLCHLIAVELSAPDCLFSLAAMGPGASTEVASKPRAPTLCTAVSMPRTRN